MNATNDIVDESALALVHFRNNFYRKKLHQAFAVYVLSWVVIAVLIGMIVYLLRHPTEPVYFPADNVGRLIQEVPVQVPNMPLQDIEAWAVEALQAAYSYDYKNYHSQLQDAQKYFTNYGWYNYMAGLTASNNLLSLNQYKYVVIAHVVDTPKLITQGILAGRASWKFQMPVLIDYWMPPYNDKSKFENAVVVTMIVQREDVLQSYKGLGVIQANASMPQNQ